MAPFADPEILSDGFHQRGHREHRQTEGEVHHPKRAEHHPAESMAVEAHAGTVAMPGHSSAMLTRWEQQ